MLCLYVHNPKFGSAGDAQAEPPAPSTLECAQGVCVVRCLYFDYVVSNTAAVSSADCMVDAQLLSNPLNTPRYRSFCRAGPTAALLFPRCYLVQRI